MRGEREASQRDGEGKETAHMNLHSLVVQVTGL